MKPTELPDSELIALALENDHQGAYFTLYKRYHKGVSAHISRFISDPEEVEDICIESFEKAFKQLGSYKSGNKFSTWLFTIARNTAFDHMDKVRVRGRKMEVTPIEGAAGESSNVPDEGRSPEEEIIDTQDHENFLACLGGLPDLYREVAKLCFIDNLGYKEISAKTGLPIGTVKTRINRAKGLIVRMMQDIEEQ